MTYHLRRLRWHGLSARLPQSHRSGVTDAGWRTLLFCTRRYQRLLRPGLAKLTDHHELPTNLSKRFDPLDAAIDERIQEPHLAA